MSNSTAMADETVVVGTVVPLTEAAKVAAKYWWIMLVAGLASLAFGVWLRRHSDA